MFQCFIFELYLTQSCDTVTELDVKSSAVTQMIKFDAKIAIYLVGINNHSDC